MGDAIILASDHRGAPLKAGLCELLERAGYEVRDVGTEGQESVDYPDFVAPAARAVSEGSKCCSRTIETET